jgi:transposase
MKDDLEKIRYLKEVQGLTFRQIAKETGIPRKKASRIYSGLPAGARPRGFRLDPYRDLIASWFNEIPSLKALQVWQRLRERQVTISRRVVERFTKDFRRKKRDKVYWPLAFLPGEEAQVDWFCVDHPKLGRLWGFTLVLSYSRYAFVHLFPRSSFEFFIEGHLQAFEALGGCPRALRYDNLRSVVLKREPLTYNPAFLEFARHYGFEIRLCNVRAGNEKGRVERLIRSIRETFLNTAGHHLSLPALNKAQHGWVDEKNGTLHRATEAIPLEKKKEERLKALPERPWANGLVHPPKLPTKTGFMIFDTNRYSVPEHAAHAPLTLHSLVDRIEIRDAKGNRVASHPRCFERNKEIFNPLHRSGRGLSEKAKRERIYAVIKNMDPDLETFLERNASVGEDPYQSAYVFFTLLREHSRGLLLSLIREAVKQGCCRMKWILSRLDLTETSSNPVSPQNASLLAIDYKPRPLDDYDVK